MVYICPGGNCTDREAFPVASQLVPVMSAPILMVKMGQREFFSCCEIMFDRGMPTNTMAPSPPGIFLKAREKIYITTVYPCSRPMIATVSDLSSLFPHNVNKCLQAIDSSLDSSLVDSCLERTIEDLVGVKYLSISL